MPKKKPPTPAKLARQAAARSRAEADAIFVEPGAHHCLHGFKRSQLARLVAKANADRVTIAEAKTWASDRSLAPEWLKAEFSKREQSALVAEVERQIAWEKRKARVLERLRRGAKSFRNPDDELIVADVAFRAWKEIQRGCKYEALLPEEQAAMRAAGVNHA